MKSVIEDISPVKKKLKIEVPEGDVIKETDRALTAIAKKAKIPGFRPGKAPKTVVKRHYSDDVQSDVMNKLISSAYLEAVQEHKISPVELPEISDVSLTEGSPLSFSATVEVRPQFELGTYDGIEVKASEVKASDQDIDETIKRLQEMYAQLEVVEGRPVEKEDTLIVDFEGFREEKPIEGAKATDYMLTIGSGSLIPGFEDQLVGMNKGETREVNVTFPADYTNKELAGKDAKFTVTLKEIKRAVIPEVNDEFAKDIGNHANVTELRARLKEDIEARKQREQETAQREELLSKLVEMHSFDVPPGMLERELQAMVRQQAMRLARQRVDLKTFDHEKFREERKDLAAKRVKGQLILDVIAERENVAITEQDVAAELQNLARSTGQSVDAIKKYYDSHEGGWETFRESLKQEKTLGLLLSRTRKVYNNS